MSAPPQRIAFVTGKLAEPALREVVEGLGADVGFVPEVLVQKISVAALMTPDWIAGRLDVPPGVSRVVIPGGCSGDMAKLQAALPGLQVERGPFDLRDLPEFFSRPAAAGEYGSYEIEILAEINHANRLSPAELLSQALLLAADGADVIDLGCTPGEAWTGVAGAVRMLRDAGLRLSIDSFDPVEVAAATKAGVELVLSVNASNREAAQDWGCEVVALPDRHDASDWLAQLEQAVEWLDRAGVKHRLDPILEPIGFGFAASLDRYLQTRKRFPNAAMMMGVGNLTELTEVDSAGVNMVLAGFCSELQIGSVLTTQVINWARSSVKELDVARRLSHYAATRRRLPKHVDRRLALLRDSRLKPRSMEELRRLKDGIRDPNYRLFADGEILTAMNGKQFLQGDDAFDLFDRMGVTDASHAFYLGWEMMKASLAVQLGKRYVQDQSLDWGLLTKEEKSHRGK